MLTEVPIRFWGAVIAALIVGSIFGEMAAGMAFLFVLFVL